MRCDSSKKNIAPRNPYSLFLQFHLDFLSTCLSLVFHDSMCVGMAVLRREDVHVL